MWNFTKKAFFTLILSFLLPSESLFAWQLPTDSTHRRSPGFVSPDGPYQPTTLKTTELIHTSLKLDFDWEKQEVNGHAVIALKPYFYPQDSVVLDARNFQSGMTIEMAKNTPSRWEEFNSVQGVPLSYHYDQFQIRIALDKKYTRNDTLFLSIRYTARPTEANQLSFRGVPVEKGIYFINPDGKDANKPRQLWTQGETTGGSSWFPTLETPGQKFTQDFFLTVEEKQLSVSNGLLVDQIRHRNGTRTDHWRQTLPHAPYLVAIAIGDFFKASEKTEEGLEVSYYVDSLYAPYAKKIFGRTPQMISFFSKLFDTPFPWEKYAQVVVRDFVSGAMENTTVTILQEETQMTDRELVDGDSDALIAHELAHHWFGNLVTCEEWGQLPLNESFANYAEYLWEEHRSGKASADWSGYLETMQYLSESQTKKVEMIRYFYEHPDHMFDSHSYAKGGRILHMLRNLVGDDAFFASLSNYLKKKQFQTAELADLRMSFEEITGWDLNWFFDQWFYRPGHPELEISHEYLADSGKVVLKVRQVQDQSQSTLYRLPVKVDIWTKGKKSTKEVVIDQAEQEFIFASEGAPELVIFDSNCQLLSVVNHEKPQQEWLFQLKNSDEFLAKYEAIKNLSLGLADAKVREALQDALLDPFWKIRQEALFGFAGYDGSGKKAIEPIVKKLAASDPHPQVRGEALLALEAYGLEKYEDVLKNALSDSSYAVVATAISLVAKSNIKNKAVSIRQFADVPNEYIASAVGDFFGDHPEPAYLDWFTGMFKRLNSSGSYSLLQAFGKYLIKSENKTQEKGLVFLEKLAREHAGVSVRYGAYQLISWFEGYPGVKRALHEIKSSERNQQLLDLYQGLENN